MRKSLFFLAVIIVLMAGCLNNPPYVVIADINNDGRSDTVITEYGTEAGENVISVFLGGPNAGLAQKIFKGSVEKNSTIVADFNGDKNNDIVFRTSPSDLNPSWKVLYGIGDGTFHESKDIETNDMREFFKNLKEH